MPFPRWLQRFSQDDAKLEKKPLFSLVLLQKETPKLSEAQIQSAANAAFIDAIERHGGLGESAVMALQSENLTIIRAGEDMLQVVQASSRYIPNGLEKEPEEFAPALRSPGAVSAVEAHTAWLSIDYLSGKKRIDKNRIYIYRRLASLAAELMNRESLALVFAHERIVIPSSERMKEQLEYFDSLEELFRWSEEPR